MAFTNKLDTNIITPLPDSANPGRFLYVASTATIELDKVKLYYEFVDFNTGAVSSSYSIVILESGGSHIIDETYSTIDGILNP